MPHVFFNEASDQRVPIWVWSHAAPPEALAQLQRLASQPYVCHRIVAMPDLHVAEGVAVGTVFVIQDTLVPAALGGDLGCGISAVRLGIHIHSIEPQCWQHVLHDWSKHIPVGDANQPFEARTVLSDTLMQHVLSTQELEQIKFNLGPKHLGTLGGGNHFVEVDVDSDGELWLLVHTGSGLRICHCSSS